MTIRTKRTICRVLGCLGLLLALGFVGDCERGFITLGKGAALAFTCELLGAALLWKGGVLKCRR